MIHQTILELGKEGEKIAQNASEASLFTGRVVCASQELRRVLPSRVRLSSLDNHPKLSYHS